MKKKEWILIGVLIVVTIIVIAILVLTKGNVGKEENPNIGSNQNTQEENVKYLEDGSKQNISEALKKTKKLDGVEITNIKFKEKDGITTLIADVENKSGKKVEEKMIKIEVLDKSGNIITTIKGILQEMQANETKHLNIGVTADVANAYDFRVSNM